MHLKLLTPERTLFDEEVVSVSIPTPDGEITVLPHHASLASLVSAGVLKVKRANGVDELAISGGFVRVLENGEVNVLAYTAEHSHELNAQTIEEAKQRAREVMQNAAKQDDVSFAAAAAGLERELARYRVAMKHRGARHAPTMDKSNLPHDENPA